MTHNRFVNLLSTIQIKYRYEKSKKDVVCHLHINITVIRGVLLLILLRASLFKQEDNKDTLD
jgi:hypothetical protein